MITVIASPRFKVSCGRCGQRLRFYQSDREMVRNTIFGRDRYWISAGPPNDFPVRQRDYPTGELRVKHSCGCIFHFTPRSNS